LIFDLTWLDWVIVAFALIAAVTGYTQGFLSGLLSFVGFAVGAIGGLLLVPRLLDGFTPGLGTAVLAILLVLVLATVGQGILAMLGARLRNLLGWQPARFVDSLLGAVLSAAGVLVAAWAIGLAVSAAAMPGVSQLARDSRLLRAVDGVVPVEPERVISAFQSVVDSGRFPDVVAPFMPEPIDDVGVPSPRIVRDPEVRAAVGSVVRVLGEAPACGANLEGSAFVVSPEHVMTNAHVVAGVRRAYVQPNGEEPVPATVVHFNPDIDVAVLHVPGLDEGALTFRDDPQRDAESAVAGYPGNGPLRVDEARVRSEHVLIGQDIYGEDRVRRTVIAVRAKVRAGNSGGPLLADDGRVYGVIFASSLTDNETGYALPVTEVQEALTLGGNATEAVSTGSCRL
jgi:S1-C subfamily serine protease